MEAPLSSYPRHQSKIGYILVRIYALMRHQVIHVLINERYAIVGVSLGIRAEAGLRVIGVVLHHQCQFSLELDHFLVISKAAFLLMSRHYA